jgi:CRP/FNR family transcriptional regulator, anaerobic regulatory protein
MLTTEMARAGCARTPADASATAPAASDRIARMLRRLAEGVALERRVVHAGDALYRAGTPFVNLYVVNTGLFKLVNTSLDGRCQMVDLQCRGNWLGLDGFADGVYACDAMAMDTGEVWALRYDELLRACASNGALLHDLHAEMGRALSRGHDAMLSRSTLGVTARVADFLCQWAGSLAARGQRTDQIRLFMSRAEIGNYLGMTLESVCRALAALARSGVIGFIERGRRDIAIPDLQALGRCVLAMDGDARTGAARERGDRYSGVDASSSAPPSASAWRASSSSLNSGAACSAASSSSISGVGWAVPSNTSSKPAWAALRSS